MAHEDEVNTNNSNDFTFEELHDAFYELLNDFKRLSLRKLNHLLTNENENFQKEKKNLLKK